MDNDNNLKQYRYMGDWYQYTETKNIDKMQDQIKKIMLFNYSDLRFHIITMIGTFFPPVVCRMAHILFTLSVFVCVEWCPTHIVLCFSFACLLFVYPLLPVSLDCPFFIVPSVFSSVYLQNSWYKCTLNHLLFNLCPETSANVDSDMWYTFFYR